MAKSRTKMRMLSQHVSECSIQKVSVFRSDKVCLYVNSPLRHAQKNKKKAGTYAVVRTLYESSVNVLQP